MLNLRYLGTGVLFVIRMCGVIIPRSMELSKALRKKVVDAYETGNGINKLAK